MKLLRLPAIGLLLIEGLSLCGPSLTAAEKVKIYILAGQSNMLGHGEMYPESTRGTLAYLTAHDNTGTYRFLRNDDHTDWVVRDDVFIRLTSEHTNNKYGNLTAGYGAWDGTTIGPELAFGCALGDLNTAPVLLIKTSWGGKSLYGDFRPPSSSGATGPYYSEMIRLVHETVGDLATYVPGYAGQGYVLAGFGWHQGWNDRVDDTASAEYEANMANFIRDIRADLDVPNLPFVIATTGMDGGSDYTQVELAQLKMADTARYPAFVGNVAVIDTRATYQGMTFWQDPEWSPAPNDQEYHWNRNAKSYTNIGLAMADAMSILSPGTFPFRLRATGESSGGIRLRWQNGETAPSNATVRIRRNGVEIAATAPTNTATYLDAAVSPGTYDYELTFHLPHAPPEPLTTTFIGGVTNLNMERNGSSVVLTWTNNMAYDGLRVSRNGTILTSSLAGTETTFSDTAPITQGPVLYSVVPTNKNSLESIVQVNFNLKCPLNILNITANRGINPATNAPWKAGDQYRLAFVTSSTTQATSSNIATYDAMVQNLANAAGLGSGTWKVIGSTSTVHARNHTTTNPLVDDDGIATFLIDGRTVIANDYVGLWSGRIRHKLNQDELGNTHQDGNAFTGTTSDGYTRDGGLGNVNVLRGDIPRTDWAWVSAWTESSSTSNHLYALSDPLTLIMDDDGRPMIFEGESPVSVVMDEDGSPTSFTLNLHGYDSNDDALTWAISASPEHGTAAGAGIGTSRTIDYVPSADWHGSDSFTVEVSDGLVTDSVTVHVTVNSLNDAPVHTRTPSVSGTPAPGTTLTVDRGDWNDNKDTGPTTLSYAYQWQLANDVHGTGTIAIPGANEASYLVRAGDEGKVIRALITCTDNGSGLPATQSTSAASTWQLIDDNKNASHENDSGNACGIGSSLALAVIYLLLGLVLPIRHPSTCARH